MFSARLWELRTISLPNKTTWEAQLPGDSAAQLHQQAQANNLNISTSNSKVRSKMHFIAPGKISTVSGNEPVTEALRDDRKL